MSCKKCGQKAEFLLDKPGVEHYYSCSRCLIALLLEDEEALTAVREIDDHG